MEFEYQSESVVRVRKADGAVSAADERVRVVLFTELHHA